MCVCVCVCLCVCVVGMRVPVFVYMSDQCMCLVCGGIYTCVIGLECFANLTRIIRALPTFWPVFALASTNSVPYSCRNTSHTPVLQLSLTPFVLAIHLGKVLSCLCGHFPLGKLIKIQLVPHQQHGRWEHRHALLQNKSER